MKKIVFGMNKLVRDKICDFLSDKNIHCHSRILKKNEFLQALKNKLLEESNEVKKSQNTKDLLEEIADVYEVLLAISKAAEISWEEVEKKRKSKSVKRGSFEERLWISSVEMDEDNPCKKYYGNKASNSVDL
jgi:predicted house-cleaning noncanonical NTP pyrophosphatase (MazG superfamily)